MMAHKASFVLYDLHPRVAHDDVIASCRADLERQAAESVETAWQAAKAAAGEAARAQAEAHNAAQQSTIEESQGQAARLFGLAPLWLTVRHMVHNYRKWFCPA